MGTLHFSALPTDLFPATVLSEQTYEIPTDTRANAMCRICRSNSLRLLDRNSFDFIQWAVFPNQMHLLTFKGLVSDRGVNFITISVSSWAAYSRNITFPFPVIFRLESFVGFFAELSGSHCTEQSWSCRVFAWHTNLNANNVSLCTQSKPTSRQYFSLTA